MLRILMRGFTSVPCIGIVGLLICVPLSLGILAASRDLLAGRDVEHVVETLEGISIILIGWGVAIEERVSLRDMSHLVGEIDDEREVAIDRVCHASGICLLIIGLFAEIGVEAVRLPNDVMPTGDLDPYIAWASVGLLVLGGIVLLHHLVTLVGAAWFGYRPVRHGKH
jgi:hypothetical protein